MLWTQSDIDLLKTYKTEGKSDKDIAIIMNRSIHSIHAKSMRLGFCEFTHFTNKQKDELKILYTKMTYVELSKYFNKTIPAIQYQIKKLKLKKHKPLFLNTDIEKIINLLKEGKRIIDITKIYNCSQGAIVYFLSKNGINHKQYYTYEMRNRHRIKLDSSFLRIVNYYKVNSKKNNIRFELTNDEIRQLTSSNCHYCGIEPLRISKNKSGKNTYKFNGIDKKDPKIGYILDNCVPCCWECNQLKSDYTYEEFNELINKIYINLKEMQNYKIGQRIK